MKMFIDTANVDHIREANDLGVICGVTTNPSLIAKEGRDFVEVVKEITTIVDGPISAEVISLDHECMVKEARELVKIHKNIVIKIPMTLEGLKAVKILAAEGVKTNVTLIFSATQALMAARAGATYVSPFLGRVDDIGSVGMTLIEEIVDIFDIHGIETEITQNGTSHTLAQKRKHPAGKGIPAHGKEPSGAGQKNPAGKNGNLQTAAGTGKAEQTTGKTEKTDLIQRGQQIPEKTADRGVRSCWNPGQKHRHGRNPQFH